MATKTESMHIADALSIAFGEFESLASELNDWKDGMPENMQGGDKYSSLEEAASALESLSEPSLPDCLDSEGLAAHITVSVLRKRASRADRCAHAVELLNAVKDWVDTYETELHEDTQADAKAECLSFIDELDNAISEAENVEFPGMYG